MLRLISLNKSKLEGHTTLMPSTSSRQTFTKNSLSSAFSNSCFSFLWLRNLWTLTPCCRNKSIKSSLSFCSRAFSNIFLSICKQTWQAHWNNNCPQKQFIIWNKWRTLQDICMCTVRLFNYMKQMMHTCFLPA